MKRGVKVLANFRRGAVVFLAAAAAFFMLGMTALVTDVGWMYFTNARIQTAVNAGWKAGYDRMREICDAQFKNPASLTTEEKAEINQLVVAVINLNLSSDKALPPGSTPVTSWDPFTVQGLTNEKLFFASIWDKHNFNASSERAGPVGDTLYLPIGQAFGATKDLSWKTFDWEPFEATGPGGEYTASDGYRVGVEYILKLGSGTAGVPIDNTSKILVHMGAGDQTEDNTSPYLHDGYLLAYGAAMWCLSSGAGDPGFTPVYWLCGYDGGSFFLPNEPEVVTKLTSLGVNYEVINGLDNVNAIFAAVGSNVIELYNRPKIAVYSSQADDDPVEIVLKACQIPYGTYNPGRYESYDRNIPTPFYDADILDGVLNNYNWLHMHHEDFTGFSGGCYDERMINTCYNKNSYLKGTTKDNTKFCSYCRNFYYGWIPSQGVWAVTSPSWGSASGGNRTRVVKKSGSDTQYTLTWVPTDCENYGLRCAEKASWTNVRWWDINLNGLVCGNSGYPQCKGAKTAYALATARGYTDAPGYDRKRKWLSSGGTLVDGDDGNPCLPTSTDMILKPSRVQIMKYDIVNIIREHVNAGGYLYAQCFAPETFDMALWQRKTYLNQLADPSQPDAYSDCLAFTGFSYTGFCSLGDNSMRYSTINSNVYSSFHTDFPNDPRCQNHTGNTPNFGGGHCDAFSISKLKPGVTILGNCDSHPSATPYIKGTLGAGEFCFGGGHYHQNCQSRRLIANNILLGALSSKTLESGQDVVYPGRDKKNFGVIDPDNTLTGSTASDYQNQLANGYGGALNIGDRAITVGDNLATETTLGLAERLLATDAIRFVIVPIVDVPPEVKTGDNATAACIYDVSGSGSDNPNGAFTPASHTFSAAVRIIGYAKFELVDPADYTRAGDQIASGDAGDLGYWQPGQIRGKFVEYIIRPGEISIPY